jgi:hypothetical protein
MTHLQIFLILVLVALFLLIIIDRIGKNFGKPRIRIIPTTCFVVVLCVPQFGNPTVLFWSMKILAVGLLLFAPQIFFKKNAAS